MFKLSQRSVRVGLCVVMLLMAALWVGLGIYNLAGSKNTIFGYASIPIAAFFCLEARMAFVRPWR